MILANQIQDDKPEIKMQGLPIIHSLSHARKHHKTAVAVLSPNGEMVDLATLSIKNNLTLVSGQKMTNGQNYLESALMQLQAEIQKISECEQFDHELIIGGEPNEVKITQSATNKLAEFNNLNMKHNGVIRIQMCHFANKKIDDTEILFHKAIISKDCICSVPKGFSIIGPQDTRAIDLPVCESQILIFNKNKSKIKHLLDPRKNMPDEKLKENVKQYYDGEQPEIIDINLIESPNNSYNLKY